METVCVIRIVFCKKSVCKIGSFIGIPKSVIPFPRNFEKKMGYIISNGINLNTSDRNARGE